MSSSITASSGTSYNNYQMNSPRDEFKQDMQTLQSALQSGDLTGAQDAFSKIQQLQQQREANKSGNNTSSNNSSSNPMQKDMNALQSALQSGNLQDAQSAFSQLQTDMKAQGGHHHHHNGVSGSQGTSGTSALSSVSSQTSSQTMATDARSGASPAIYA